LAVGDESRGPDPHRPRQYGQCPGRRLRGWIRERQLRIPRLEHQRQRDDLDDVVVLAGSGDPDPDPENPFARGPDPTVAAPEDDLGPFDVDSYRPFSTPGFGSGTIWYPDNTNEGPFAAIAVIPGYLGNESSMDWVGPRLASNGFVVLTIQPNSIYELPSVRADSQASMRPASSPARATRSRR
jgi:hypothetical protein